MLYFILAISALALGEVIIAAFMIVGIARLCDYQKDQKITNDLISILAGSIAENKNGIKQIKKDLCTNYGIQPEKTTIIREDRQHGNYICESCIYSPPSSLSGKPCSACDPDDPLTSCYQGKGDEESA